MCKITLKFFLLICCFFYSISYADRQTMSFKEQKDLPGKCNLSWILSLATDVSDIRSIALKLIENHEDEYSIPLNLATLGVPLHRRHVTCQSECNDVNLNSFYESVLARNIFLNLDWNSRASKVFRKIILGLKKNSPLYLNALNKWNKKNLDGIFIPSELEPLLQDRMRLLEDVSNPPFAYDFLTYYAKTVGLGLNATLTQQKDSIFKAIHKEQGRTNLDNGEKRSQYGILKFDYQKFATKRPPWKHWARDVCHINPSSSKYNREANRVQIPLACGISGTTALVLLTLFESKADLNEEELRLLLLSLWSILCSKGGHSLQEVLTAARYTADHLKNSLKEQTELRTQISHKSLNSLIVVTQNIQSFGNYENSNRLGSYFDQFTSKIDDPHFQEARTQAFVELLEFYRTRCHLFPFSEASKL